jgi:hypothetical protein
VSVAVKDQPRITRADLHEESATELLLDKKAVWNGLDGTLLTGDRADIFNVVAGFLVKTVARGSRAWKAVFSEATGRRASTARRSSCAAMSSWRWWESK